MARERGMRGYSQLGRSELAERLGVELPEPVRKARRVAIVNPNGTTTTYPSINKAARALGKHAAQIYALVANGDQRVELNSRSVWPEMNSRSVWPERNSRSVWPEYGTRGTHNTFRWTFGSDRGRMRRKACKGATEIYEKLTSRNLRLVERLRKERDEKSARDWNLTKKLAKCENERD